MSTARDDSYEEEDLEGLEPQEAHVIRLLYNIGTEPMNLADIARILHISRERVRQIESNILKRIRQSQKFYKLRRRLQEFLT